MKVDQVREELEQMNKEEKDRLSEELDRLRQLHIHTPTSSNGDESGYDDPYNLMQSIAFVPLSPLSITSSNPSPTSHTPPPTGHTPTPISHTPPPINSPTPPDISSRVVIGEESEETQNVNQSPSPVIRNAPSANGRPDDNSPLLHKSGTLQKDSIDSGQLENGYGYGSEHHKMLEDAQSCLQSADGGASSDTHEYLSR